MKVHRIQGIAFSSYLIETPAALFLVDSGFRWFERLITGKVRAMPLLKLPAIAPTFVLEDGRRLDDFGLPGALHFTPGHSKWCISLLLDDGTAFAGDLLIGPGHMTRDVAPPAMAADPAGAFRSIRKLLDAGATRFMPAHGRAFRAGDVREMLAELDTSGAGPVT